MTMISRVLLLPPLLVLVSLLLTQQPDSIGCEAVPTRGGVYEQEDRDAEAYYHTMMVEESERENGDDRDHYFDDDYSEEEDDDGYDDDVSSPMRPSWFDSHNGNDKDDEFGGRPPLPFGGGGWDGKDDHGFGGGGGGGMGGGGRPPRPPMVDSWSDYSSICPARRPPIEGDTNGGGGGGGGKPPVGTPSEGSVMVSRLPGLMADFAFNPRTGDVVGVDPIADRAYLFRRQDLEGDNSNSTRATRAEVENFTALDVGRTPVDVVYKRYGQDKEYYVVVCRHDPHLHVINATDFTLIKKVAISSSSGSMMIGGAAAVASSEDPEDPFVYHGRRGPMRRPHRGPPHGPPHKREVGSWGPATLSAFDVRTMTDRGVVRTLEDERDWEWDEWEWEREEEEWDWDYDWDRNDTWGWDHEDEEEEVWGWERPDGDGRGHHKRPGGGRGGRSPFELAVSADGNVVYTRSSPHGPTIAHHRRRRDVGRIDELMSDWNATADDDDIPRFVEDDANDHRHRSEYYVGSSDSRDKTIAFVHPGPFGEVVGLGPTIHSSDLTTELVELDFVPGCFFRNRSLIVGYVDSTVEHPHGRRVDRPDILMAASYNTFDPMGRPLALTIPRADHRDEDDAYLEYGAHDKQERYDLRVSMCVDGLEDGKRLRLRRRLFADDERQTVIVAHGDDVTLIPIDELQVPHEPFLRLEYDAESGGHLVAGGLLEVVPLHATDPSVEVYFENLPRGAMYDGERGYLSWAPTIEQIGTHVIEATLRHDREGSGMVVERVVPLTINVSLPFIELPFVDGGCPLVDERGRFVVVWSNDQDGDDRDHYGHANGDYPYYYSHKHDYYHREPRDEDDPHESRIAIVPTGGSGKSSESSIPSSTMTRGGLPRIDKVMLSDDLVIVVHRREGGHRDPSSGTTTVSFYDVETFELVKTLAFRRGGGRMEFEMCSGHELLATTTTGSSGYYHHRRPRPDPYYYGPMEEMEWIEEIYHGMGGNNGGGYPHEIYDLRDFSVRRFGGRDGLECDSRFRDEPTVDGVVRRGVLHDWGDGGEPLLVLDSSRFPTVAVNWTRAAGSGHGHGPPPSRSWLPGPNVPCSSSSAGNDDSNSKYDTAWMDGGRLCVQLETRTDRHLAASADDGGVGVGSTTFEARLRVFSIDGNMIADPTVIRRTCPIVDSSSHLYGRGGDGPCQGKGLRPKLLVAGRDVYVILGREITVWSGTDSQLTSPPGGAVTTIEPRSLPSTTVKTRYFRLIPRQSEFVIDPSDREVSLSHVATGGTPPYEYFVESPPLANANDDERDNGGGTTTTGQGEIVVRTDVGTGTTLIDGVRLGEVGLDTLIEYHKMHGGARLRALSLKTVEPWTETFGGTEKPDGVPIGLPLRVMAVDAEGLTAEMVYFVYTHVPYEDVVDVIGRGEGSGSRSTSSAWNHNQTATGGWGLSGIFLVAVSFLAAVVIGCLSILVVRLNRRVAVLSSSSAALDETQLEPLQGDTTATSPPSPQVNKAIMIDDDASSSTDCASAREEN